MENKKTGDRKNRLVWVKDREGNEFVCAAASLIDPDDITDEEKAQCMDAAGPRGLVSPL